MRRSAQVEVRLACQARLVQFQADDPRGDGPQRDRRLEPGERRTQAEVRPDIEGQMLPCAAKPAWSHPVAAIRSSRTAPSRGYRPSIVIALSRPARLVHQPPQPGG